MNWRSLQAGRAVDIGAFDVSGQFTLHHASVPFYPPIPTRPPPIYRSAARSDSLNSRLDIFLTGRTSMNGAESLVRTLVNNGVKRLLHQPRHFRDAFCRRAGPSGRHALRAGLFEGVVTGAADGYYRMTGNPAATLLHLGPGSATAWRICTTRRKRIQASSISSASMRLTISSTMRR